MTTEVIEKVDEIVEEPTKLDKNLVAEIDGAVEVVSAEQEKLNADFLAETEGKVVDSEKVVEDDIRTPEEISADEEKAEAERVASLSDEEKAAEAENNLPAGEKKPGEGEKVEKVVEAKPDITDDHLERAVKAGMTIAMAKTFQNAEALEGVVTMLEAQGKEEGDGVSVDVGSVESLLAQIPDLDPADYDENVVSGFKAMKALIISQQAAIADSKSRDVAHGDNWFSGQVLMLGDDFAAALKSEPSKLSDLKSKFDVLSAGYKASGVDVDQSVVFNEAKAMVLGDVVAKAATVVKTEKLAERKKLHTSRPAGAQATPTKDVEAEIADELDKKHFGKK